MSKYICSACQREYDEDYGFCHECGGRLVEKEKNDPALNLGDANAISGGVSINQSKNISSHDTHYHSTTVERMKSESELKLDATNQLRAKAEGIMAERGRIDSVAMNQLRPLSKQLGIDEETFKSIIKDVRSNRNGAISGLSAANARYLQQAQQAVKTNDMDALSNLTPRLEAMAAISQDDNVQFMYYLTLSILYPIKSMEVYERQMDENYWRTFWAIISYIRTGKHAEATKVLALFDPLRYEKSEEDQNLLEAYFNIMKEDKDGAQEFLDEILGEPTEQVKPLLRAVESTQYEEEPESLEVRFYMERVMSKSDVVVKSQKKTEAPATKEEPAKTEPKPERKAEPQPKAKAEETPAPEIKKDNKEAEELYAKACAVTGFKRVMLLQKAADAGSFDAMFDLAECYDDGNGVEKNRPLAIKWLTKAADSGHVRSQAALGDLYIDDGIDQNFSLSEKYFMMAAQQGNDYAQAGLALLYLKTEEYDKSLIWARKAAQMNQPYGLLILGRLYDEGLGIDVDHKEALKYFEKAADQGNADAQNIVGNIYTVADFVKHDYKKAFDNYQKAASQGHLYGMLNFGLCYQEGQGTDMDIIAAENWIRKAADGGLQDAIDILNNNPLYNHEVSSQSEENNNLGDAVCQGSMLQCSCGTSPIEFRVTDPMRPTVQGLPMGNIMDFTQANIGPFGMCQSMGNPQVAATTTTAHGVFTPMPCMPNILNPWTPGGQEKIGNCPALLSNSKCMCTYGGVISIAQPIISNSKESHISKEKKEQNKGTLKKDKPKDNKNEEKKGVAKIKKVYDGTWYGFKGWGLFIEIGFSLEFENCENRSFKIKSVFEPEYGGNEITKDLEIQINKRGNVVYDDGSVRAIDGEYDHHFKLFKSNLALSESGVYSYQGNISLHDENGSTIDSRKVEFSIEFKHKIFGDDKVKVLSFKSK